MWRILVLVFMAGCSAAPFDAYGRANSGAQGGSGEVGAAGATPGGFGADSASSGRPGADAGVTALAAGAGGASGSGAGGASGSGGAAAGASSGAGSPITAGSGPAGGAPSEDASTGGDTGMSGAAGQAASCLGRCGQIPGTSTVCPATCPASNCDDQRATCWCYVDPTRSDCPSGLDEWLCTDPMVHPDQSIYWPRIDGCLLNSVPLHPEIFCCPSVG